MANPIQNQCPKFGGQVRVKFIHAWLIIGFTIGLASGIIFMANRSGQFDTGADYNQTRYLFFTEWTFFINEESFATFKERIDAAQNAGFNGIRFSIYWPNLEPTANNFQWQKFDDR